MKKILVSLSLIVAVGAVIVGATGAFFSDTQTSTGNTFTAGAIALTVDSTQHYNGNECVTRDQYHGQNPIDPQAPYVWSGTSLYPVPGTPCNGSWSPSALGADTKFFNFGDIKPGDNGEDTISLHIDNNPAWACAAINLTGNADNGINGPEAKANDTTDGPFAGELAQNVVFATWLDNSSANEAHPGDNIHQADEPFIFGPATLATGPITGSMSTVIPLADSQHNGGQPLPGGATSNLGLAWCLGTMTVGSNGAISCDGSSSGNITQTDSMQADIQLSVVQSRNNPNFLCSGQTAQEPKVGANLSAYVAPTANQCNVTVTNGQSIQTNGIDVATSGQTVCVDNGTYAGPVTVNKDVTLASLHGPSVTTINGGVKITSSNVKVEGFAINTGIVSGDPDPLGFYVAGGSNISIDSNEINGNSQSQSHGVLFVTSATYSNVKVTNNNIHNNTTGVYTNPHTGNLDITDNDIHDNSSGIGGFTGATVQYNEFNDTAAGGEAIGTDSTYDGSSVASFNNFLNGSRINDYGAVALVSAENNFWNTGGVNQTTSGQVDFTPEAGSQYAHN